MIIFISIKIIIGNCFLLSQNLSNNNVEDTAIMLEPILQAPVI